MHPVHGRVLFLRKRGYKFAEVQEIDQGIGWDPEGQKYKGVKTRSGWMRGQNYSYLAIHTARISDLKPEK